MNVVFVGGFTYPRGMAGTRYVQLTIDGLHQQKNVSTQVVVLRQSSRDNAPSGVFAGVPYETVMPDALRAKAALLAPVLWKRTVSKLKACFQPDSKNIVFHYGPPGFDSVVPLSRLRKRGYAVVYCIVEDDDVSGNISRSPYHRWQTWIRRHQTGRIGSLADGIVVISSRLQKKFQGLTGGATPMHLHPVLIDIDRFPLMGDHAAGPPALFYGGSFGVKDGVEDLLAAFDQLAVRHRELRLVLSGKGTPERMHLIQDRIALSTVRHRIDYRGYLDDDTYYDTLNSVTIPCMTRIDSAYAHGGFPFKLGEYLATGKPVVATRASDVGEMLVDRRHAMLVEPGSVDGIVQAVQYLLDEPGRARQIGAEGRRCAADMFDYRQRGERLYGFLASLFAKRANCEG